MGFIAELRKRNVLKVGASYLLGAWLLIEASSVVMPLFGVPESALRVLVIAAAIGLPVVLAISWSYEFTPEGVRKTEDLPPGYSPPGQRLNYVIIILLVLSVAVLLVREGGGGRDVETSEVRSIAVLPFANLSAEAEPHDWFSAGLAEDLVTLLAKVPELSVAARTSTFAVLEDGQSNADIAQRLNVRYLLLGSVRRDERRVRVTARLVEPLTDFSLWSEVFDLELDDIFDVQHQIASGVAASLEATLVSVRPRATSPEAYALFLQARQLGNQHSPESMAAAVERFERVLALDPEYVPAIEQLAAVYMNQAGFRLRDRDMGFELARAEITRALGVEPAHAPSLGRLAWIAMVYDGDLQIAANRYQRALQIEPGNFGLISNAAVLAVAIGRLDLAVRLLEESALRDPVSAIAHSNLGNGYYLSGRLDPAEQSIRNALELSPLYAGGNYRLGLILIRAGKAQEALPVLEREPIAMASLHGRALALQALGRNDEASAAQAEFCDTWGEEMPGNCAQLHAFAGDADAALAWLEKESNKGGSASFNELQFDPFLLDSLDGDPRWSALLERVGRAPAQLAGIEFTLPSALDSPREF